MWEIYITFETPFTNGVYDTSVRSRDIHMALRRLRGWIEQNVPVSEQRNVRTLTIYHNTERFDIIR